MFDFRLPLRQEVEIRQVTDARVDYSVHFDQLDHFTVLWVQGACLLRQATIRCV
jgi:hypothetical protein